MIFVVIFSWFVFPIQAQDISTTITVEAEQVSLIDTVRSSSILFGARSVATNSTGTRLVTGSDDNRAYVYDLPSGAPRFELLGHTDIVNSAEYSPNGNFIITGSRDSTVRIWDATNGSLMRTINLESEQWVWDVAVSPNSEFIAAAAYKYNSSSNDAIIWNASNGEEIQRIRHPGWVNSVQFSPDGTKLLTSWYSGGGIWDIETGELLISFPTAVYNARFSPDGSLVVTGASENSNTYPTIWNASNGERVRELPRPASDDAVSVEFSPSGKFIAVGGGFVTYLYDAETGEELTSLSTGPFGPDANTGIAFTADERYIITKGTGEIAVYSLLSWQYLGTTTTTFEISSRDIVLPNCGGNQTLSVQPRYEQALSRQILIQESRITGTVSGSLDSDELRASIDIPIGIATGSISTNFSNSDAAFTYDLVETTFGVQTGQTITQGDVLTLSADRGTSVTYGIRWDLVLRIGTIVIRRGLNSSYYDFIITSEIQGSVVNSISNAC